MRYELTDYEWKTRLDPDYRNATLTTEPLVRSNGCGRPPCGTTIARVHRTLRQVRARFCR